MAMYYQSSSEIQGDGLQTLYLMNPNYNIGYSDTQPQPNMLFSNSAAALAPPHQQFAQQQDISAAAVRHHYSMWSGGNINPQTPRGLSLSLAAHHQQTGFDKSSISGCHDFPAGPSPVASPSNAITGSKYLKAAQELLDEVAKVGNHRTDKAKPVKDPTAAANKEAQSADKGGAADLSTAQRQEIQMKKAKLHSMLDEVEQRCRQYEQQMQMIVGAFEQAAGPGSARSYTQLALKTISNQFRWLKSTITAQVKALNMSLGDEGGGSEVPRLRLVDRQQSNAWRPQRGLPERAVSVLRAWLFQHFLHPYPKDTDKQMLAKQTGLTRSQVSNWFINARVRLWKPMVEEMYLQETNNQPSAAAIKPEPTAEISPSTANFAQLISSLNMDNLTDDRNPKKPRNSSINPSSAAADQQMAASINRYGGIDQQLAAGFGQGNGFSLSLGLPPLSHQSFDFGKTRVDSSGVAEGGRINEMIDFQNRPPQLLPDFVA